MKIDKTFVFFDVGANWGTSSLKRCRKNSNFTVYAFEPVPELYNYLSESSRSFSDRYHVYNLALSNYDGESIFNIADNTNSDWGCSSLNHFSENINTTWPGRNDLKFNRSVPVKVSRLDTWFDKNNVSIDKIDYFHCDTQGTDLKVLEGMGKYISLIKFGVVECAANNNVKLYKENHTVEEMECFLSKNGFKIVNKQSNDCFNNEINLYFEAI